MQRKVGLSLLCAFGVMVGGIEAQTPKELFLRLDESDALRALAPDGALVEAQQAAHALQRAFVGIDLAVLEEVDRSAGPLAVYLNLFPDAHYLAYLTPDHDERRRLWHGTVEGLAGSQVTLLQIRGSWFRGPTRGDVAEPLLPEPWDLPVTGYFELAERRFDLESAGREEVPGLAVLYEIDTARLPEPTCDVEY